MKTKKRLQELTLKDNFMFGAVMTDPEHCRDFLERALGFPIDRVEVNKEKCLVYHPEYKGVRLDVYAKDGQNTHYNVEMQVLPRPGLRKRTRYYHSQIDMELLLAGQEYSDLPDTYVIFVCDFDPFGEKKYRYTFENLCLENHRLALKDGKHSVFLSTCGENDSEVSGELVKFLQFVKADGAESIRDFEDAFVERLQNTIKRIKKNREMEERYMVLEEMLKDERKEGFAEGLAEGHAKGRTEGRAEGLEEGFAKGRALFIVELLEELGTIPEELKEKILGTMDTEILKAWVKPAVKAKSVEQFMAEIQ